MFVNIASDNAWRPNTSCLLYNLFIQVWSFHLGMVYHSGNMVFSFGYGLFIWVWYNLHQHTCSEHVVIVGQYHVNQMQAIGGFAYIFAELDWH